MELINQGDLSVTIMSSIVKIQINYLYIRLEHNFLYLVLIL